MQFCAFVSFHVAMPREIKNLTVQLIPTTHAIICTYRLTVCQDTVMFRLASVSTCFFSIITFDISRDTIQHQLCHDSQNDRESGMLLKLLNMAPSNVQLDMLSKKCEHETVQV